MKEYKFEKIIDLESGANLPQSAGLYAHDDMADYEVLSDKNLNYDNVINLSYLTDVLSEFFDVNAVVISNGGNLCSVALGKTVADAYKRAFDADAVSAYSGSIGFSKKVDFETLKLISSMNVQTVLAPEFDKKSTEFLKEEPNFVPIKLNTPLQNFKRMCEEEVKITPFGVLIQSKNESELDKDLFKVVTKTKPTTEQIEDAIFGWKIVKHTKTSSAVVVKDFATLGIAQGQTNSVNAVEIALNSACDGSKDAILALDNAIDLQEVIFAAAQGRISLIIQTGGSARDAEIIKLADKYNIAMIMTGVRNYKY